MASPTSSAPVRRGPALEYARLGWNVVGVGVLTWSVAAFVLVYHAGRECAGIFQHATAP